MHELLQQLISGEIEISTDDVVKILNHSKDLYYNGDGSDVTFTIEVDEEDLSFTFSDTFLSDEEFNELERFLSRTSPSNPYFVKVGSEVRTGKTPLPFIMPSLDELDIGDYAKWISQHNLGNEEIINGVKYDGVSIGLVYNNGKFVAGYSRGDGTDGADITRHLLKMEIPKTITDKNPLYLRAEGILTHSDWLAIKALFPRYKTARGYVAGSMNSSVASDAFYERAHIIITSIENRQDRSDLQNIEDIRSLGFRVMEYDVALAKDLTDDILTAHFDGLKETTPYAIDGTVLRISTPEGKKRIPKNVSSNNPSFGRKFKTSSEVAGQDVTVVAVHYNPSKAAFLKPRIEIIPTEIGGVLVTYTTGFNAGYIRDNKIGPGTILHIVRSGDVIPDIRRVVKSTGAAMPKLDKDEVYWTPTGVDLVLKNPENHPIVKMKKMLDFFTKINVANIREASINKLIEAGYDTAESVIKLDLDTLKATIGNAAGEKIYAGIIAKLNPVLPWLLIAASQTLGRGIGSRKIKRVYDKFNTHEVTVDQLVTVDGFADKTVDLYLENLDKVNTFLKSIEGKYRFAEEAKPTSSELANQVFVFTKVRDNDLQKILEGKGAKIGSSVSKNTTVLICKDPNESSAKLDKARDLGVRQILSLSEAWNQFGN